MKVTEMTTPRQRTLVAENGCNRKTNELRAECAELHEARGLLDFIKTQHRRSIPGGSAGHSQS